MRIAKFLTLVVVHPQRDVFFVLISILIFVCIVALSGELPLSSHLSVIITTLSFAINIKSIHHEHLSGGRSIAAMSQIGRAHV